MQSSVYYISDSQITKYDHPFNKCRFTPMADKASRRGPEGAAVPSIYPECWAGTISTTAERRAWSLVLDLIMRPLTRKFGLVEVAPEVKLSVPDSVAFTWCVKHFGDTDLVKSKSRKPGQMSAVDRVLSRFQRSHAKTWVSLVSGGGVVS